MYLQDHDTTAFRAGQQDWENTGGIRQSFLLHIRPKKYPQAGFQFRQTFHLGFWTTFLLAVEGVTGILLMFYYTPTPDSAYFSIQRLASEIPFGQLFRNLHRLAGDLLLVCAFLHLLRVVLTGSYSGQRRFTWVTGMLLFLLLLALAFSGYLLPWDQLSYWAVTVGTSLFQAVPLFGEPLQQMLRGGTEIGADGLLRFYVLHVLVLPVFSAFFLAVHYYRLVRLHGTSQHGDTARPNAGYMKLVSLWPEVVLREIGLILIGLIVLLTIVGCIGDAPLGSRANPLYTPNNSQAPWFFLWVQGLLTLGPTLLFGVVLPLALVLAIVFFPYFDRGKRRPIRQRPKMLAGLVTAGVFLILFSYLGGRETVSRTRSPETILNSFVAEDERRPLQIMPYDHLVYGVYPLLQTRPGKGIPKDLAPLIAALDRELQRSEAEKQLTDAAGVLIVEPWQDQMKRITLRFTCRLPDIRERQTYERMVYRHAFSQEGDIDHNLP